MGDQLQVTQNGGASPYRPKPTALDEMMIGASDNGVEAVQQPRCGGDGGDIAVVNDRRVVGPAVEGGELGLKVD